MIRVLLVDDHGVVRDGLRVLLEAQPDMCVVGDAENGRQAMKAVLQLRPDVVVMDIAMPELNGIEATLQMHEACPETEVLILSMHSTTEHIFRALQAGARGYLLKDSAGTEVVDAVRAAHAGRRYLSHKIAFHLVHAWVGESLEPHGALAIMTYGAAALGVGCALYRGVELPFLRLRSQLERPRPTDTAASLVV